LNITTNDDNTKSQYSIGSCSNAPNDEARTKMYEHHDDRGCSRLTSIGKKKCNERYIWDTDKGKYVYCKWKNNKCEYKDTCVDGGDSSSDESSDEDSEDEGGACPNAPNDEARTKMYEHHDDRGCSRLTSIGKKKCNERYIWDTARDEYVYCQWDDDKCEYKDTCGDGGDSSSDESSDEESEDESSGDSSSDESSDEDSEDEGGDSSSDKSSDGRTTSSANNSTNNASYKQSCDYSGMMTISDHNSSIADARRISSNKERIACEQDLSVNDPVCDTYTQIQYPNSYSASQIMGEDNYNTPGRVSYAPCGHNTYLQQLGHYKH